MIALDTYVFDTGFCTHPQHIPLRNRKLRPMKFYSMFAVLVHPKEGVILFDTGYGTDFKEHTRKFPEYIYQLTTPVHLCKEDAAVARLRTLSIEPKDVRHIVISHFHADHIGALRDFPKAQFWFHSCILCDRRYPKTNPKQFPVFVHQRFFSPLLPASPPLHAAVRSPPY